jgi:hypothetical protein
MHPFFKMQRNLNVNTLDKSEANVSKRSNDKSYSNDKEAESESEQLEKTVPATLLSVDAKSTAAWKKGDK